MPINREKQQEFGSIPFLSFTFRNGLPSALRTVKILRTGLGRDIFYRIKRLKAYSNKILKKKGLSSLFSSLPRLLLPPLHIIPMFQENLAQISTLRALAPPWKLQSNPSFFAWFLSSHFQQGYPEKCRESTVPKPENPLVFIFLIFFGCSVSKQQNKIDAAPRIFRPRCCGQSST